MGGLFLLGGGGSVGESETSFVLGFALLAFSLVLLAVSFLLHAQTIKTLKWLFPEMPHADFGEDASFVIAGGIAVFWLWGLTRVRGFGDVPPPVLLELLTNDPRGLVPGFLLGSLVPFALTGSKLLMVAAAGNLRSERTAGLPQPRNVALFQGALTLVNFAASVVTLFKALPGR